MKDLIEDIYPLSPLQQGMLFHSVYDARSPIYFEQYSCTLSGELNVRAFERAWQRILERHTILRSGFLWEETDDPVQVVYRSAVLPVSQQDWCGMSRPEQEAQLQKVIAADRTEPFDLSVAPLMRLELIRIATDVHFLVWSFHHLVLDGWSGPMVLSEVSAFYEAFCQGRDLHLPNPRPYRDYIAWLQKQEVSPAEASWRSELRGFIAPTRPAMLKSTSGPALAASDPGVVRIVIPESITTALQSRLSQYGLTTNTLLQGVWALALSQYSGDDEVLFGTVTSGRPPDLAGVDSMIGLFINTLPVRVRVRHDQMLPPWLGELQTKQLELRRHEYVSLTQIQGWSEVPHGTPFFDSLLVFENYPAVESIEATLRLSDLRSFSKTNYPLTLIAARRGPELSVELSYHQDRLAQEGAQQLLEQVRALLEKIVTHPEQSLSNLMAPSHEQMRLLEEWNDTTAEYPRDRCVHELFERQAELTPEAVAVVVERKQLTYRELNAQANHLARHLRELGVGPESPVGVCFERSLEMLISVLAVLKAGGCYVPMDPAQPLQRSAIILNDVRAQVLLTDKNPAPRLSDLVRHTVRFEQSGAQQAENLEHLTAPENSVYAIYTSGSTGTPKGVQMPHRALINLLSWQAEHIGTSLPFRTLQFASLSFDVSFQEIFSTWCTGGTLVQASDEARLDPAKLLRLLVEERIQRLLIPPAVLQELAAAALELKTIPRNLREVITAGEQLQVNRQVKSFFAEIGNCSLHNHYGPTETHVASSCTLTAPPPEWEMLPPIGRPIANTQIHVLDSALQPAPFSVTGELYLAGENLARGYVHSADLTAEKFLPNPYTTAAGARLYRTGDLARHRPDGNLEFIGRRDHQVKIRGHRVEMGEIEAALMEHPAVREAVVTVVSEPEGQKRLTGYVIAESGIELEPAQLRQHLSHRLPEHMLPATFVQLESWPKNASGKVDRHRLPVPVGKRPQMGAGYVAPSTPAELVIEKIWREVLSLEQIGLHDNFFELGGHSLSAMRVVARLRTAFQTSLPVHLLFESPTISRLVASLVEQYQTRDTVEEIAETFQSLEDLSEDEVKALLKR